MGTGNTILYWYGACGIFVLFFTSVVVGLMIVGRRRKSTRYRTTSLEAEAGSEPVEEP